MRTLSWKYSILILVVARFSSPSFAADPNEFVEFSTTNLPGQLYVPPEASSSARPVILFLHGAGETGSDNLAQINGNIDNLLTAAKDRGAFLYAPQATTVVGGIFNWNNLTRTDDVMTMIDQLLASQNADQTRLYVTGLSMGGGGTWSFASRYPNQFAATVPIAGVSPAGDFSPATLEAIPTWAFHARDDGIVSKNITRGVVDSILSSAGESTPSYPADNDTTTLLEFNSTSLPLKYTEYPTGNHFIWGQVYATAAVYDWMFSHAQFGDFDTNGRVDGLDFLQWQTGDSPNPYSAVELADWEAHYASPSPLTGNLNIVPEPSSLLLLVLCTLLQISREGRVFSY